jgi:plasmid maintenance system antidote protein VapI
MVCACRILRLTTATEPLIIISMPRRNKSKATMTELLRKALSEAESLRAVAIATGVQDASLVRFVSGRQSLRLDKADKLAAYFGIECRQITE